MDVGTGFAAELRRLREARSLTQEELAERAGITVKAVGALERGERLRPYPHTVRSLADALGLGEPERDALVATVPRRGTPAPVPAGPASPVVPMVPVVPPQPLLGRDADLALLVDHLRHGGRRVVTLTGPGGVGKTRLALEAAVVLAPEFPGGCVVVELASAREPGLVVPRIGAALGLPESSGTGTVDGLAPLLAGRRALVVLDNLEQLLGCASDLADLVARCPELVLLVTSRAPLRIRAEHDVPLAPLLVPEDDGLRAVSASAAVELFLDRTSAAGAVLTLDEDNAATVAEICRRLDGLPLALELAAAGSRVLTPAALLARLDAPPATSGPRDLPERQRTMTSALDWSLELLEPEEVSLFERLAVFGGGFGLDAAQALGGSDDVVTALAGLVEQSLVMRVDGPGDGPRFRLLEPVRQYAGQRLQASGLATATADLHAAYFHDVVLAEHPALHGAGLVPALDRLEADHADLRSAYLRLLETDRYADAAELGGSLWLYLALRGHAREGLSWLERLGGGATDAARCRGLTGRAGLYFLTGDIPRMQQDVDTAMTLARRLDDDSLAAETGALAGHAAVFAGELDVARPLLAEALERATAADDAWALAHVRVAQGQLELAAGDLDAADDVLRLAVEGAREVGNAFTLATALNRRATLTELRGDDAGTAALLGESTELSVAARLSWTLGYTLPSLAGVAVRAGSPEVATRLFAATASLSAADASDPRFPVSRALSERGLAAVRDQLGDRDFSSAWEAGRIATGAEIAELAREVTRRARG